MPDKAKTSRKKKTHTVVGVGVGGGGAAQFGQLPLRQIVFQLGPISLRPVQSRPVSLGLVRFGPRGRGEHGFVEAVTSGQTALSQSI